MRPGPWLLVAGDAAGLLALVIFVGHPNFRHPGLTSVTRRLSNRRRLLFRYQLDTRRRALGAQGALRRRYGVPFRHHRGRVQPARAALSVAVRAAVTMATRRSTISLLGS